MFRNTQQLRLFRYDSPSSLARPSSVAVLRGCSLLFVFTSGTSFHLLLAFMISLVRYHHPTLLHRLVVFVWLCCDFKDFLAEFYCMILV